MLGLMNAAQAQKFGYVNSQEILAGMAEVKQADANLEALQKQLQKKVLQQAVGQPGNKPRADPIDVLKNANQQSSAEMLSQEELAKIVFQRNRISISSDRKSVLWSATDGQVRMIDLKSKEIVRRFQSPVGPVDVAAGTSPSR